MAIYWILIYYYYINSQVLLVISGNYEESSLEDTQNIDESSIDIQQSGLSSNEQEDRANMMQSFSSEEKNELTELKGQEMNHGRIKNFDNEQISHNELKTHGSTHNKHQENLKTSSNNRVTNEVSRRCFLLGSLLHSANKFFIHKHKFWMHHLAHHPFLHPPLFVPIGSHPVPQPEPPPAPEPPPQPVPQPPPQPVPQPPPQLPPTTIERTTVPTTIRKTTITTKATTTIRPTQVTITEKTTQPEPTIKNVIDELPVPFAPHEEIFPTKHRADLPSTPMVEIRTSPTLATIIQYPKSTYSTHTARTQKQTTITTRGEYSTDKRSTPTLLNMLTSSSSLTSKSLTTSSTVQPHHVSTTSLKPTTERSTVKITVLQTTMLPHPTIPTTHQTESLMPVSASKPSTAQANIQSISTRQSTKVSFTTHQKSTTTVRPSTTVITTLSTKTSTFSTIKITKTQTTELQKRTYSSTSSTAQPYYAKTTTIKPYSETITTLMASRKTETLPHTTIKTTRTKTPTKTYSSTRSTEKPYYVETTTLRPSTTVITTLSTKTSTIKTTPFLMAKTTRTTKVLQETYSSTSTTPQPYFVDTTTVQPFTTTITIRSTNLSIKTTPFLTVKTTQKIKQIKETYLPTFSTTQRYYVETTTLQPYTTLITDSTTKKLYSTVRTTEKSKPLEGTYSSTSSTIQQHYENTTLFQPCTTIIKTISTDLKTVTSRREVVKTTTKSKLLEGMYSTTLSTTQLYYVETTTFEPSTTTIKTPIIDQTTRKLPPSTLRTTPIPELLKGTYSSTLYYLETTTSEPITTQITDLTTETLPHLAVKTTRTSGILEGTYSSSTAQPYYVDTTAYQTFTTIIPTFAPHLHVKTSSYAGIQSSKLQTAVYSSTFSTTKSDYTDTTTFQPSTTIITTLMADLTTTLAHSTLRAAQISDSAEGTYSSTFGTTQSDYTDTTTSQPFTTIVTTLYADLQTKIPLYSSTRISDLQTPTYLSTFSTTQSSYIETTTFQPSTTIITTLMADLTTTLAHSTLRAAQISDSAEGTYSSTFGTTQSDYTDTTTSQPFTTIVTTLYADLQTISQTSELPTLTYTSTFSVEQSSYINTSMSLSLTTIFLTSPPTETSQPSTAMSTQISTLFTSTLFTADLLAKTSLGSTGTLTQTSEFLTPTYLSTFSTAQSYYTDTTTSQPFTTIVTALYADLQTISSSYATTQTSELPTSTYTSTFSTEQPFYINTSMSLSLTTIFLTNLPIEASQYSTAMSTQISTLYTSTYSSTDNTIQLYDVDTTTSQPFTTMTTIFTADLLAKTSLYSTRTFTQTSEFLTPTYLSTFSTAQSYYTDTTTSQPFTTIVTTLYADLQTISSSYATTQTSELQTSKFSSTFNTKEPYYVNITAPRSFSIMATVLFTDLRSETSQYSTAMSTQVSELQTPTYLSTFTTAEPYNVDTPTSQSYTITTILLTDLLTKTSPYSPIRITQPSELLSLTDLFQFNPAQSYDGSAASSNKSFHPATFLVTSSPLVSLSPISESSATSFFTFVTDSIVTSPASPMTSSPSFISSEFLATTLRFPYLHNLTTYSSQYDSSFSQFSTYSTGYASLLMNNYVTTVTNTTLLFPISTVFSQEIQATNPFNSSISLDFASKANPRNVNNKLTFNHTAIKHFGDQIPRSEWSREKNKKVWQFDGFNSYNYTIPTLDNSSNNVYSSPKNKKLATVKVKLLKKRCRHCGFLRTSSCKSCSKIRSCCKFCNYGNQPHINSHQKTTIIQKIATTKFPLQTHQSSINAYAIHANNQQDFYRRRNNLPPSKNQNFNANVNQNIIDARVVDKNKNQAMNSFVDQTEKKDDAWNKILPYLPPRLKNNELNQDENITKIAHMFAKHIVNTLPLDLQNNKLAYDLAVKMIYERLKMHNDAEFLEHNQRRNPRFNQSSNNYNRANDCCCCDDENSAVIMKMNKEESYKCNLIMNTAPSDGYILLENIGWFKIHTIPKTWNQARKECITEGAHLAFMESLEEIEWILDKISNLRGDIFLGMHSMFDQNEWTSVLDTPIKETGYIKWSSNIPNHRDAYCSVLIKKSREIIHELCDKAHIYVCKISI